MADGKWWICIKKADGTVERYPAIATPHESGNGAYHINFENPKDKETARVFHDKGERLWTEQS